MHLYINIYYLKIKKFKYDPGDTVKTGKSIVAARKNKKTNLCSYKPDSTVLSRVEALQTHPTEPETAASSSGWLGFTLQSGAALVAHARPFSFLLPAPPFIYQSTGCSQICGQVTRLLTCLLSPSSSLPPPFPSRLPSCFFNGWTDQETDKSHVTVHLGPSRYPLPQSAEGPGCLQATSVDLPYRVPINTLLLSYNFPLPP